MKLPLQLEPRVHRHSECLALFLLIAFVTISNIASVELHPRKSHKHRILNGSVTQEKQFTFFVFIGTICSGVIIQDHVILTSASCALSRGVGAGTKVLFGSHNRYNCAKRVVKRYCFPTEFEKTGNDSYINDVAMLMTEGEGIKFNDTVSMLQLFNGTSPKWFMQSECYLVGAGRVDQKYSATYARYAQVKFIDCPNDMHESVLCYTHTDATTTTCKGDPGGPIVCKADGSYELVALASSFSKECEVDSEKERKVFTAAQVTTVVDPIIDYCYGIFNESDERK